MSGSNPIQGRTLYLIASVLSAIAVALGLWDMLAEGDGGDSVLWGVVFPFALLLLMITLYFRSPPS